MLSIASGTSGIVSFIQEFVFPAIITGRFVIIGLIYCVKNIVDKSEAKENTIKAKENTIKAKEQLINSLKESMHKVSEAQENTIKAKEQLINSKNEIIDLQNKEILRAHGLMTSRGIFERVLQLYYRELYPARTRCNITDAIHELLKKPQSGKYEGMIRRSCSHIRGSEVTFLNRLYSKLSQGVHGNPWYGGCIKVYEEGLTKNEVGYIKKLAVEMGLNDKEDEAGHDQEQQELEQGNYTLSSLSSIQACL